MGFAQLLLVLGICLFVPAGTLDYFQAWLYLAAFFGSVTVITLYLWRRDPALLQRRVNAGPSAEQRGRQKAIQAVAAIAFIALFVVCSLDHRFGWSTLPWQISLTAEIGVLLGFVIVFLVFKQNTYTAATIEVAAEQSVVTTGVYAVVRHPMYAGALLMLIATPIALGSVWGLVALVPMFAAIIWRLLDEEEFLLGHLAGYAQYRARVRYRLVPWIW